MEKLKNIILICIYMLSFHIAFGQISTNELPISFGRSVPSVAKDTNSTKVLRSINMVAIEQEDIQDELNGLPPRFGYPIEVNYNTSNSGKWTLFDNGDKLWRLTIISQNAMSINLLYDKFWLPENTKLFVYSTNKKHSIGAFTSQNNKGDSVNLRGFATGLIYSDSITIEYYQPREVVQEAIISIGHVVHGYRYINLGRNLGSSGSCQVNINCEEGQNWQKEKMPLLLF